MLSNQSHFSLLASWTVTQLAAAGSSNEDIHTHINKAGCYASDQALCNGTLLLVCRTQCHLYWDQTWRIRFTHIRQKPYIIKLSTNQYTGSAIPRITTHTPKILCIYINFYFSICLRFCIVTFQYFRMKNTSLQGNSSRIFLHYIVFVPLGRLPTPLSVQETQ